MILETQVAPIYAVQKRTISITNLQQLLNQFMIQVIKKVYRIVGVSERQVFTSSLY